MALSTPPPSREEIIDDVSNHLVKAQYPFVLSGAGMGVASGLETFRGAKGHWNKYRPEDLSSIEGFQRDPIMVWDWYNERITKYLASEPNNGHHALAKLQEINKNTIIVTQNVDGLQERAGGKNIFEIHGSIFDLKCTGLCGDPKKDGVIGRLTGPFLGNEESEDPYRHKGCGGLLRPGVVFFGDNLPYQVYAEAQYASKKADIILIVGTSAEVYPATELARIHDSSVILVEINPNPVLIHKTRFVLTKGSEIDLMDIIESTRNKAHQRSFGR